MVIFLGWGMGWVESKKMDPSLHRCFEVTGNPKLKDCNRRKREDVATQNTLLV